MEVNSWVRGFLLTVVTAGVMLLLGCQGATTRENSKTGADAVKARTSTGAEAVEVRKLDDPANPYLGQYELWDQWVYEHMVSRPKAWKLGEYPENWDTLSAMVDKNGYMIPMLESTRQKEIAISNGEQDGYFNSSYYVYGEGELPKNILDGFTKEANRIRAGFTPPIPTWLVENTPSMAMLFPNGDVITLSELGDASMDCCSGRKQTWYRYNSSGEFTGQSKVTWWEIYYTEKHGEESWPEGDFENRMDGYVLFKDRATGQILSAWDYDGTRLDSEVPPPFRDPHPFMYLNQYFIIAFYELQNSDSMS